MANNELLLSNFILFVDKCRYKTVNLLLANDQGAPHQYKYLVNVNKCPSIAATDATAHAAIFYARVCKLKTFWQSSPIINHLTRAILTLSTRGSERKDVRGRCSVRTDAQLMCIVKHLGLFVWGKYLMVIYL